MLFPSSFSSPRLSRFAPWWFFLLPLRLAAVELHVAPGGNDASAGTVTAPFATIMAARDAIRALRAGPGLPAEGVTVWLHGGWHDLPATVAFDSRDSGTAARPVVYAGWPDDEVRITGGRALDPGAFVRLEAAAPVWSRLDPAARGQVWAVDLRAAGITDFGTLRPRGFGMSAAAPLELFFGGRPMTLAQWPNRRDPWARTATAPSSTTFTYSGTRPDRWAAAPEIWMHGFWAQTWADFHVKVASIDGAAKTVTLAGAPGTYGILADRPFVAYNLLEELDEPGEYYVDRATGILYFWPPGPLAGATIQVSRLEGALLQFAGAQFVTLRDLVLEAGRGPLVRIDSGDHLRLERCLLRNAGQYAAQVAGTANGLDHCAIVDCGEDGVRLSGGSRAALTAGGNFVTNCRIHRVARLAWTYHPGVSIGGCGHVAAHNLIDDLPHSAVLFSGNNHNLEANEIRRVCRITSDAGAIYTGRDWGYRGNVIRGNFLHHIRTEQDGFGAHGVYLDDCVSGIEVSGNVFHRIDDIALMAGGGRDSIMRGNLIAACGTGHRNDDRGRTRITNLPGDGWNLLARLAAEGIRYQQPPWSTAYPACAAIPDSWDAIVQGLWRNPEGCVFTGNAGWANTAWMAESNPSGTGVFSVYAAIADNAPANSVLFDDAASVDRARRPAQLRASPPGFAPIAFAAIGRDWAGQPAPTTAPVTPVLAGSVPSATDVDLQWSDDSNLARNQESGFTVERRNEPAGAWQTVAAFGSDVDFHSPGGLAPATSYAFRVRAANHIGAVYSNALSLRTEAAPMVPGPAVRLEAETAFFVVNDVGSLGTVGVSNASLDSGQSVRLYDPGDTLRLSFNLATAGAYRLGVRLRSGGGSSPTSYWPRGYRFKLDGADLTLRGDATTVSVLDPSYGQSYWGTMWADIAALAAGAHTLEVSDVTSWGVVDYLEIAPLSPRRIVTFADWQTSHFAADQLADAATSGASSRPTGDSVSNLLKYALGLDLWTPVAGNGVRVTLDAGRLRLDYTRPVGLSDVAYVVEASDDAATWAPLPQVSVSRMADSESLQATDRTAAAPGARRYVRLRVVRGAESAATEPIGTPATGVTSLWAPFTAGVAGFFSPGAVSRPGTTYATDRLPAWAHFDADSGAISGTPTDPAGTVHAIDLRAREGGVESLTRVNLVVAAAGTDLRMTNLSVRARVLGGRNALIPGWVVTGLGARDGLVRGVGPGLEQLGVPTFLPDPVLTLFRADPAGRYAVVAANDNWDASGNGSALAAAAAGVGAFALPRGAKDAALLVPMMAGSYTATIEGVAGGTGIGLCEVYDAGDPGAERLSNLSGRGYVGPGSDVLIGGLALAGGGTRRLLVRAVGPGLANIGLADGMLPDPVLTLFVGTTPLAENDDWEKGNDPAEIRQTAQRVGAFALDAGSRDAVLLPALPAGIYTLQVSGKAAATGIALVEVYAVPP